MAAFSKLSITKLSTCDTKLISVMNEAIKYFDFTIVYGFRAPDLQHKLYMKGRKIVDNKIIVTSKKDVVTYCDGTIKKSMHNYYPSKAVDIVPYYSSRPHIRWNDKDRMIYLAGHVMAISKALGIELTWGADWNNNTILTDQTFMDYAHFQIK